MLILRTVLAVRTAVFHFDVSLAAPILDCEVLSLCI